MTITEFLQHGDYTRLEYHNNRWMFWHSDGWHVLERKRWAREATELLITTNEEEAIAKLIEGDEESFGKLGKGILLKKKLKK